MSVIGKKLNPIQSSGGGGNSTVSHNNDDGSSNSQPTQSITPDGVLSLTKIAEEYMCSPGIYLQLEIKKKNKGTTTRKIDLSAISFGTNAQLCWAFLLTPTTLFINKYEDMWPTTDSILDK